MRTDNKRSPDYLAYTIRELGDNRVKWIDIGVAFTNRSTHGGLTITLNALPLDGRLVIMPVHAQDERTRSNEDERSR